MTQLIREFNYSMLDPDTAKFLREKEEKMAEIVGHAYTELGRELKEAQEELAKRGYGCFYEWFESLGFKKDQVYRLIGRYELLVANCDKREMIEDLPVSLTYEMAKPSAHPEAVKAVLDGEIKTRREYLELEQKLKEAERRAQQAESSARHFEALWKQTRDKPPRVVYQPDEEKIKAKDQEIAALKQSLENVKKQLEATKQLQQAFEKDAKQYEELKKKLEFLHRQKDDLHRQIESATALSGLAVEIDNFLKTKLAPIRYSRALERLDSEVAVRNLTDIIESVEKWCEEMRQYLPKNGRKVVIDLEPAG